MLALNIKYVCILFIGFTLFVPRVTEGPISVPSFHFMYSTYFWQDAGVRTRVAETAARCAIPMSYTHPTA